MNKIIKMTDGKIYEGDWKNGVKEGKGVLEILNFKILKMSSKN